MKYFVISGDKDIGNIDVRTTATRMILPNNVRYLAGELVHLMIALLKVTGWPGQRISVGMQAIDELNFSTAGTVELLPHNFGNKVSHKETVLYS